MNLAEVTAHPLDRAKRDLPARPAVAIETVLKILGAARGQRSDEETADLLDVMAQAIMVYSHSAVPAEEDPVLAMLADRKCDRVACASFLRLLVFDDDPFSSDPRLRDTTALFDRALANSLYPDAGIAVKDQAFEKRDKLRTLVSSHEESLIGYAKSLGSLDGLDSFRQGFGQLFGKAPTRVFIAPFLPEIITRRTFDELFGAVDKAAGCTDMGIIGRSEEVEARCGELDEAANRLGTHYCEALVLDLTQTLRRLVRAQVREAGFADPAKVSVSLRPKRYPFNEPKAPVTLRLDIANAGPGHAQDLTVEISGGTCISFDEMTKTVGLLGPGSRVVQFHGIVVDRKSVQSANSQADALTIKVKWRNPDHSEGELEEIEPLKEQPGGVPWEELAEKQPYTLEPAKNLTDFVGRAAIIRELTKVVRQSGSARIEGEKRVGKTSLAYAVAAAIGETGSDEHIFIQLESGDFGANTPEETVSRLGRLIAERVRREDRRLSGLAIPDFTPGLTALTEFFGDAYDMAPDRKFVIVLDEFDAMPHSVLYRHEPVGDAFFLSLRSLSGKPNIGFVLIGGEDMQWILAARGQTLNKFKVAPLGYFPEDQIDDYAELVRAPVLDRFQFADDAIETLYSVSAGNPWMTKLLLSELFERQVERRDLDVQADDVEDAIIHALPKFSASSFQHFWDDAIQGDVKNQELLSLMRRRVLLAFARCLQGVDGATEAAVVGCAAEFGVDEPTAKDVIRGLLDRAILQVDDGGALRCRVPLFERWLVERGAQEITISSGDEDTLIRRQRSIEELRPTPVELAALAERWRVYRGSDIRPDQISAWLGQFGGPAEQRLIMPILENLRFYTRSRIDGHLRDLHQFVLRELASRGYEYTRSGKQRLRNDFLVCGLEGGGSGAGHLLKPYRDENLIYKDHAVDPGEVRRALGASKKIRAVLILDDFVGTGGTAATRLKELSESWTEEAPWPDGVDVFLLAACGFDSGLRRVESGLADLALPVTVRAADVLGDEDRCFDEHSRCFENKVDRERARDLCNRLGAALTPDNPLGFGKSEAAVCFEYRCPNNTLSVLWEGNESWTPLFPRF